MEPEQFKQQFKEEQATKYVFGYTTFSGQLMFDTGASSNASTSVLKAKQFDSKEDIYKYVKRLGRFYDIILQVKVVVTPLMDY